MSCQDQERFRPVVKQSCLDALMDTSCTCGFLKSSFACLMHRAHQRRLSSDVSYGSRSSFGAHDCTFDSPLSFQLGRCMILHFSKRTFIHFFLPRRPLRLQQREKSRPPKKARSGGGHLGKSGRSLAFIQARVQKQNETK